MKTMKVLVTALGVAFALPIVAQSAEQAAQSPDEGAKPAKCLEAVVNPVTGFAFCGLCRKASA